MSEPRAFRINVGCGTTPIPGWLNFDNSPTVRLARVPWLCEALAWAGAIGQEQLHFAHAARAEGIGWADATRRIPVPDASASVVYSSHMLEHLDRQEARQFLAEARRVLRKDGVIRLVVPDLRRLATRYVEAGGGADGFVEATLLGRERPRGVVGRLKHLALGDRGHAWMYDATSLAALLTAEGFSNARELPPGTTRMPDPGALDLHERADESVYIEAEPPGR